MVAPGYTWCLVWSGKELGEREGWLENCCGVLARGIPGLWIPQVCASIGFGVLILIGIVLPKGECPNFEKRSFGTTHHQFWESEIFLNPEKEANLLIREIIWSLLGSPVKVGMRPQEDEILYPWICVVRMRREGSFHRPLQLSSGPFPLRHQQRLASSFEKDGQIYSFW